MEPSPPAHDPNDSGGSLPLGAPFPPLPASGRAEPSPAAEPTGPTRARVGMTLGGRYRLAEELGGGASGRVFLAEDGALGVQVCIKVLHDGLSDAHDVHERMRRELMLARRGRHPGLCRVFDMQIDGALRYLVMELIEGTTLASVLRRSARDVDRAIDIVGQVADAVGAAHAEGVVHRDLKPENIMVRPDGRAAVLDFGIASAMDLERLTRPGFVVGTRRYLAPELWNGGRPTPACDVWALGVLLYGFVCGRLPFRGSGPVGVLTAIHAGPPPNPRKLNPGVSRGLSRIIARCLRVDPAGRYPDAAELAAALAKLPESSGERYPTPPVTTDEGPPELAGEAPAPVSALAGPVVDAAPPAEPTPDVDMRFRWPTGVYALPEEEGQFPAAPGPFEADTAPEPERHTTEEEEESTLLLPRPAPVDAAPPSSPRAAMPAARPEAPSAFPRAVAAGAAGLLLVVLGAVASWGAITVFQVPPATVAVRAVEAAPVVVLSPVKSAPLEAAPVEAAPFASAPDATSPVLVEVAPVAPVASVAPVERAAKEVAPVKTPSAISKRSRHRSKSHTPRKKKVKSRRERASTPAVTAAAPAPPATARPDPMPAAERALDATLARRALLEADVEGVAVLRRRARKLARSGQPGAGARLLERAAEKVQAAEVDRSLVMSKLARFNRAYDRIENRTKRERLGKVAPRIGAALERGDLTAANRVLTRALHDAS